MQALRREAEELFQELLKSRLPLKHTKSVRHPLDELSKRFEVFPQVLSKWNKEFVERSSEIFETKAPEENLEKEKERLFTKIGQLENFGLLKFLLVVYLDQK